jgi:hypothetical protein
VAAALTVVVDVLDLFRSPGGELEIVGHDPGSFLQLFFENRAELVVSYGKKIHRDQIGGSVILLQEIAMDDMGGRREAESLDFPCSV